MFNPENEPPFPEGRDESPKEHILEPEYLEEIDPYVRTMDCLVRSGDRDAILKYLQSPECERDFTEHIEIDGDRSMMELLNSEDAKQGQSPSFSEQEMNRLLRMHHQTRMTERAEEDQRRQQEEDRKRLDQLRKSLKLLPDSGVDDAVPKESDAPST